MTRVARDWDRFWFAPRTTRVLSLYRIGLGLVVLIDAARRAPWLDMLYSDLGLVTIETLTDHLGRTPSTLLAIDASPVTVRFLFVAWVVSAACFTIGLATRASSIAVFLLSASFLARNPLVVNSGGGGVVSMLFLFLFAPADQAYAVDRWRRARRSGGEAPEPAAHAPWAQRAMQCQIALLWLMAGYHKAHGTLWYTGSAMYYVFGQVDFTVRGVEALMNYPLVYTSLTLATVLVELAIPFLLWFRPARPYAAAMAIGVQGWILLCMTLPVFPLFTMFSTILFFEEDEVACAGADLELDTRASSTRPRREAIVQAGLRT